MLQSRVTRFGLLSHRRRSLLAFDGFVLLTPLVHWPSHSLSPSLSSHTHARAPAPTPGNYRPLYTYVRRRWRRTRSTRRSRTATTTTTTMRRRKRTTTVTSPPPRKTLFLLCSRVAHINFRFPSFITFFRGPKKGTTHFTRIYKTTITRARTIYVYYARRRHDMAFIVKCRRRRRCVIIITVIYIYCELIYVSIYIYILCL